jgi:hydroxyacylglutathione hydrolase
MTLTCEAIPLLSDNYAWLLTEGATTAVCDPSEAAPVEALLQARGRKLDMILLTHHHADHIDGVPALVAHHGAKVIGAAADAHRLPKLDVAVRPGDSVAVGAARASVIDTPGHTVGHIAFHFAEAKILLCADTLFTLGCGRVIEGTMEQMYASLMALAALPGDTLACSGHEYTLANLAFALSIEPDNAVLQAQAKKFRALREAGKPTVPTTIADELAANPFLRAGFAAEFARRREAKNTFRG